MRLAETHPHQQLTDKIPQETALRTLLLALDDACCWPWMKECCWPWMMHAVDACLAGPVGMEDGDKQRLSSHTCQQFCLRRRTSESSYQVADGIVQECATNMPHPMSDCWLQLWNQHDDQYRERAEAQNGLESFLFGNCETENNERNSCCVASYAVPKFLL